MPEESNLATNDSLNPETPENVAQDLYTRLTCTNDSIWKEAIKQFNQKVYSYLDGRMKELDDQRETLLTTIQSIKQG